MREVFQDNGGIDRGARRVRVLTPDGRPPLTIEELKIGSLSSRVQTYVNLGTLIGRESVSEDKKVVYRSSQADIRKSMNPFEERELNDFRSWQGMDEFSRREKPNDIA